MSKVGKGDLIFGVPSGFMQDYKSLCAVVTICALLLFDPKLDFYNLTSDLEK